MARDLRERGVSLDQRRTERQQKSAPLFEKRKTVLEANATMGTQSWKQAVYDARDKLTRFLDHGEGESDPNLGCDRLP